MKMKLVNRGTEGEIIMEGRLDTITSPDAQKLLQEAAARFDKLVLNMEKLEYISSAGLRVLKIVHMDMRKKNGEFVLKNVNKLVMEVFEMSGYAGLLKFE